MIDTEFQHIYDVYKNSSKITILKKFTGLKAIGVMDKLLSIKGYYKPNWMDMWTSKDKKSAFLFIYKRTKISKKYIGFKLMIGSGKNKSVIGEEVLYDSQIKRLLKSI